MGFIPEDSGRENIEKLGNFAGPNVNIYYYDSTHQLWYGSVLVACHTTLMGNQAPILSYTGADDDAADVVGDILVTHAEWSVVRHVPVILVEACQLA
jgi:hypothetical protein